MLRHLYEEQAEEFNSKYDIRGNVRVHARIFECLIADEYVRIGTSVAVSEQAGRGYREHVVPCAYIRDLAFELYYDHKSIEDVALVIKALLKIALITPDEAKRIPLEYKYDMPRDWDYSKDSINRRLDDVGINLID